MEQGRRGLVEYGLAGTNRADSHLPAARSLLPATAPLACCSTHPNDLGHRAVAELLAASVARALEEVQGGGSLLPAWQPGRQDEPLLQGTPPPMVPGNADAPTTLCAIQVRQARPREDFQEVMALLWLLRHMSTTSTACPEPNPCFIIAGGLQGGGGGDLWLCVRPRAAQRGHVRGAEVGLDRQESG